MPLRRAVVAAACTAWVLAAPHSTLAWGATGHRMIGRLAIETLPADLPEFLRDRAAVEAVGELAREPDRWKDSGRIHDADRDPGHFLDLDDGGKVVGGPDLAAMPATRAYYDAALRRVGYDSWRAGYLPYSIVDGWQQLTKDFAYWRAETAAARMVASGAPRGFTTSDFSSASSWNTAGAVSTQSPLLMQRVLFTVTLRLAIASPCFDRLIRSLELRVGGRQANPRGRGTQLKRAPRESILFAGAY